MRILLGLIAGLACFLISTLVSAAPVQRDHLEAELIAENHALSVGETNWVALKLRPDPGWHVYWKNPGDSGIATRLQWQLPDGIGAGEIHWPYPHQHKLGELTNYGYGEQTLHLVPLQVTARPSSGETTLKAKASWLVCADICIPGEADLSLTMPVIDGDAQPDPAWAPDFAKVHADLPQRIDGLAARFSVSDDDFSIDISGVENLPGAKVDFYPEQNDLLDHAAAPRVAWTENGLRLSQVASSYFFEAQNPVVGVLVIDGADQTRAITIRAVPGDVAAVPQQTVATQTTAPTAAASPSGALPLMLVFALTGGLLLNLMPCVFPVLSLKALSVVRAGDAHPGARRTHALAYTAGVLLSFVAIAVLLIVLKAGGAALGWGFHLQSAAFVALLAYLMFTVGLSLSGAISIGGRWMGLGQSLTQTRGFSGSFFTGVLAVVVASPCTAPFMGPAMGLALAQPGFGTLLIFIALGLGLALPFLLIGFIPRLAALLPRPGAWMEVFKQFLAFPMYLTAVWLLWVLGGLTDRNGMALALVGLVALSLGLWMIQHRAVLARAFALAVIALAVGSAFVPQAVSIPGPLVASQAYSDARFEQLRQQGRSVFVDFTADWCLTCKVNERGALQSASVKQTFERENVEVLIADWTRADPEITTVLQRYGRSGVPLYLASVRGGEPQVLPQILTPAIIADAFAGNGANKLAKSTP